MDNTDKLLAIFEDDPFGLLEVKTTATVRTEDERLISSFEEINDFFDKNGREPKKSMDMNERKLYSRLNGIKEDHSKIEILKEYDRFNLLPTIQVENETVEVNSIDDILNNDILGLLDNNEENDIFTFNHTPKEMNMPDYIAKRKPCKDFNKFEDIFKSCQNELSTERRKLHPFRSERDIEPGFLFILSGVLGYVSEVGTKKTINKSRNKNTRLRVIFENGTESDMLLRSLGAALYKDGKMVTQLDEKILDKLSPVTNEDKESGFIYILKSLSEKAQINSIQNLYKIGFSTIEVKDRIKNARKEPTYLMADVSIVGVYQCFNMNPQKLENLLHRFFGSSCLNIEIFDEDGSPHKPREWFIAPLEIIEYAISLIISGDIVHYKYDNIKEDIVGI